MNNCKNIFVALTYRCNSFCKKCMTRYHIYNNQNMSEEVMQASLNLFKKINYDKLVSFGSGESLVYPKFEKYVTELLAINDKIRIRVLSNGILFNKENFPKIFMDKRVIWGITLDGFKQEHLKGMQNNVDIEAVKEQIENWCEAGLSNQIYVNYTLHNNNFDGLIDFVDWSKKLGISEIYVTELKLYNETMKDIEEYRLDYENKEFQQTLADIDRNVVKIHLNKECIHTPKCWERGRVMPLIDVDGSLSFCAGREGEVIGNIKENGIEDIWKDYETNLKNGNLHGRCATCHSKADIYGNFEFPKNKFIL